jgi:acyl-CoA synthetase (NDP forming)
MRIIERIRLLLTGARERGETAFTELDAMRVLEALGIATPKRMFVADAVEARATDLAALPGDRAVVKVVAPGLFHKTEVGGVAVVAKEARSVSAAIGEMADRFRGREVAGYLVCEFVEHETGLAGELLVGLRWTDDFGPVAVVGAGGVHAEFLADCLAEGSATAMVTADMSDDEAKRALLSAAAVRALVEPHRGRPARIDVDRLLEAVTRLLTIRELMPDLVAECEINPLVPRGGSLVALDALVKLGTSGRSNPVAASQRPIRKIRALLEPRSVAIVGVSQKLNPGHIIVNNMLGAGFDRERIFVVKPGAAEIEGCRCVDSLAALPSPVDLLVVSVDAARTPDVLRDAIALRAAESLIVIPGGFEEKRGGEDAAATMRAAIADARREDWEGPVLNGGNCLGIRSAPGHVDTMFIPDSKLPAPAAPVAPVAFVSQSGAFAIAKLSKLDRLNPKYAVSVGNQLDLTVGDYLTYLKDDDVWVFAVYVEGFKPLDGRRLLAAAREITRSGRTVILYRAGRTPAGAEATSSHTASIAGDYAVTRELARTAGVVVAETLEDFDDLVTLFTLLNDARVDGTRLAAVSNAGFECVAIADNIGDFTLTRFGDATTSRIRAVLERCRIASVVDAHNPLDLTPMADDEAYEAVARAMMEDTSVDVGVVGCVPLTSALATRPDADGRFGDSSVVSRLARLRREIDKPWVAVVDSGRLYDPMARALLEGGVPTFRSADRALRLFGTFVGRRLGRS